MLDVRTYVIAARRSAGRTEPAAALFMVAAFGLVALVLIPIWLTFDLASTWDFTTGLRNAAENTVYDMGAAADGLLGLSLGAALAGVVFTGFTLLPSLFELAFPTVQHPLLNLILLASIVFDYVTDWGKASDLASGWATSPALQFVYTALVCAFVSVGVQAILVCCLTVVIFGCLAIIRGGARQARTVVIDQ